MSKDLVVCRCEEVTEKDIKRAVRQGADNVDAVKRATRAGMGLCQSHTCQRLIASIIHEMTGKPLSEIVPATKRPPLRAIPAVVFSAQRSEKE